MIKIKFLTRKFLYYNFILRPLFGPLNTFMRKGKDPTDPNPDADPEHFFFVFYDLVIPH